MKLVSYLCRQCGEEADGLASLCARCKSRTRCPDCGGPLVRGEGYAVCPICGHKRPA